MNEKNCSYNDLREGVSYIDNHIFFYDEVNKETILLLRKFIYFVNKEIYEENKQFNEHINELARINNKKVTIEEDTPKIYLHINSPGGSVTAGLSAIDLIQKNKIPIVTIVEGMAASAATLLAMSGTEKQIQSNSVMLLHRIRGGFFGTHTDLEDEKHNWDIFEAIFEKFYLSNSKLTKKTLKETMKNERIFNADECLNLGLVDEII